MCNEALRKTSQRVHRLDHLEVDNSRSTYMNLHLSAAGKLESASE